MANKLLTWRYETISDHRDIKKNYYSTLAPFYHVKSRERAKYATVLHSKAGFLKRQLLNFGHFHRNNTQTKVLWPHQTTQKQKGEGSLERDWEKKRLVVVLEIFILPALQLFLKDKSHPLSSGSDA